MLDLDLVEALLDKDIAMIGKLYFITAYLFPRDYKKVVDHFLFVLVEDFSTMNLFPWGKLLCEITLSALKDGLSRRNLHYRLQDEQPSVAKLEGPDYFSNPNYKKPVQLKFSRDSSRDKSKIERSVDRADTSGKSGPSVLLLTDSSIRQARVPHNDDDDFVDPPPRW
ncbi:Hypothetical predicted protein [Olea europaea subsp. europaea]|uniref:DUF1985 domain-containing protein n=1 Tax=Olea europaea subsp. europaea TaxID=158383 RepID=A0A8S0PCZ2_OLEEU|nr:Hypothetical predicted protein [Olea europaea subsp. europaea]